MQDEPGVSYSFRNERNAQTHAYIQCVKGTWKWTIKSPNNQNGDFEKQNK